MTKKEKIEYTVLGVAVIAIAAVLYFFMFKPQAAAPVPVSVTNAMVPGSPAGSTANSSSLLPSGTSLKTGILTNPAFTSLVQPVYPQVDPSEVGSPDVFNQ